MQSENEIICELIDKLKELTGEDFHGYRSEVYSAISISFDKLKKRRNI